jgi:hypothetical protein
MTLYRVVIGEDWRNTKTLSSCTSLIQAKETAKKYALNGWYFAICKCDLVGRWTMNGLQMKKFYLPGERTTKKKSFWE